MDTFVLMGEQKKTRGDGSEPTFGTPGAITQ